MINDIPTLEQLHAKQEMSQRTQETINRLVATEYRLIRRKIQRLERSLQKQAKLILTIALRLEVEPPDDVA